MPGYEQAAVESLFEILKPTGARVTRLSAAWFLHLYLPLSVIWKVAPRIGKGVIRLIATIDQPRRGARGLLLAEVTK